MWVLYQDKEARFVKICEFSYVWKKKKQENLEENKKKKRNPPPGESWNLGQKKLFIKKRPQDAAAKQQ